MKKITIDEIIQLKKPYLQAPIVDVLAKRFSPRVFTKEKIDKKDVASFFEAARWAPSSFNRQPWYFFYGEKDTEGFDKLSSCLSDYNDWAKKASLLILGGYIKKDDYGENAYARYDLGQAVMSLVTQAQTLGYFSHQMGGFDKEKAKEVLQIKAPLEPWVMIAVGKLGNYQMADKDLIAKDFKKRQRKNNVARKI